MESPEAYLERTQLRALLTQMLEATCKEKPDKLAPYLVEYLQREHPGAESGMEDEVAALGTWRARTDVQPTAEGLRVYLQDLMVRPQLEAILETVLREQPTQLVAFMIERLCKTPLHQATGQQVASGKGSDGGKVGEGAAAATVSAAASKAVAHADADPEALERYFEAIASGDVEEMVQLLDAGVPVESTQEDGRSGLHLAAEGEQACVEALLQRKCPVDILGGDEAQQTALMVAIAYEDLEIVQMLLQAGASKEAKDSEGKSALDYAEACSDAAISSAVTGKSYREPEQVNPETAVPKRRFSVSSESIDVKATADLSSIPVVPKDEDAKQRIKECVQGSILFKGLDPRTLEAVVMSMTEVKVSSGEVIIKQGDYGDFFYIVDSGSFDCFVKKKDEDGPGTLVLQYGPKTTFGELALMYNAPRAASVIATSDSVLWAMERGTFRQVLVANAAKEIEDAANEYVKVE